MRVGHLQLVIAVFLVAACEASSTNIDSTEETSATTAETITKTNRNLLSFNNLSPHGTSEPSKTSSSRDEITLTEEERMVGMAGAPTGANRGRGTTVVNSDDNGPNSWEKCKARWKGLFGDEVEGSNKNLRWLL